MFAVLSPDSNEIIVNSESFPAEGGLRSSTVVSDLSEHVMNLTNAHNSLMTSGFRSLIFVVRQTECAECERTSERGRS